MAVEIAILCLRPLPAMGGGWSSAKWRIPKLANPVQVRLLSPAEHLLSLSAGGRAGLGELTSAPFAAGLRMEGPATTFETAIAYATVVADACAGVVLIDDEVIADRRASTEVWSGTDIEARWRAIDAEAARAEPGYQPVRGPTDDHRPTQSFTLPIKIEDGVVTLPSKLEARLAPGIQPGDEPTPRIGVRAEDLLASAPPRARAALSPTPALARRPTPPMQQVRPATEDDWSDVMPK